jgi:hypothetical protein
LKLFADLASLPEDVRIATIAETARGGKLVAVFVDDDETADRYVQKLEDAGGVRIVERRPFAVGSSSVVFLKVGPGVVH